jgi:hypothetical protein
MKRLPALFLHELVVLLPLLVVVPLFVSGAGCSKNDSEKAKAEEGVPVADYCEKHVTLSEQVAAENAKYSKKKGPQPGEPTRRDQIAFCRGLLGNAKSEEPEAYACMAKCMMAADTRDDEQACIKTEKCLAKAKNKKLFSNQSGD